MNRAKFLIKRQYKKITDKILGIEGKLDLALTEYNEQILKLADAMTACEQAGLTEKVEKLKQHIIKVKEAEDALAQKKSELVAKVKQLEAEKMAAVACAGLNFDSPDNLLAEVENYVDHLEAELKTYDFLGSLN